MIIRRVTTLLLTTALALSLGTSAAFGESIPYTCANGSTVWIEVGAEAGFFQADGERLCAATAGDTDQVPGDSSGGESVVDDGPEGYWLPLGTVCDNGGICNSRLLCDDPDRTPVRQFIWINPDGTSGETRNFCPGDEDPPEVTVIPPTPAQIFEAFEKVAPTTSELSIQPPGGRTLVNFPTIFSTRAEAFTTPKIDMVPGFSIRLHVLPMAYIWDYGDGTEKEVTDWAGEPWSKNADVDRLHTHTYETLDPVKTSVTVRWEAEVSLNGGEWQSVDGTVDATSPEQALEILEARPELVEDPVF